MEILLNIIYYIIPFLILLGILVFVHEFGHFIVARILGVTVTDFSIGFGKALWSFKDKHNTNWKISVVPLGGYCQFLGDADASSSTEADLSDLSEEDKKGAFPLQKAWKKLSIAIAGPLFNYIFAIVIFIMLFYGIGRMVYPSVVGGVIEDGAAQQAGILVGDRIVKVNGVETSDFQSISNEVVLAESDEIEVEVYRPVEITVPMEQIRLILEREQVNDAASPVIINEVLAGSEAEQSGFKSGDILKKINDFELNSFSDWQLFADKNVEGEAVLKIERPLSFNVILKETSYQPEDGKKIKRRMLGILSSQEVSFSQTDLSFGEAVKEGFIEAYDLTANTLRAVGQMITGKRGGKDVGGIIRIAEMSGDVSKEGGLISFIYFMALLSVNLGLINLLPIPVLDGGNVVIFFIEMITGKEISNRVKNYIFKFGLFIILAIMVLATWNDVVHLIGRWFGE